MCLSLRLQIGCSTFLLIKLRAYRLQLMFKYYGLVYNSYVITKEKPVQENTLRIQLINLFMKFHIKKISKGVIKHLFVLKLSNPYISRTPIKFFEVGSCPIELLILSTILNQQTFSSIELH